MSNNDKLQHLVNAKSGKKYTIEWEENNPSSFRIIFIGNIYFLVDDNDEIDPAMAKVKRLLEEEGYTMVMNHSVKEPGKLVMYSLRFKKKSGKPAKVLDLMNVVKLLSSKA